MRYQFCLRCGRNGHTIVECLKQCINCWSDDTQSYNQASKMCEKCDPGNRFCYRCSKDGHFAHECARVCHECSDDKKNKSGKLFQNKDKSWSCQKCIKCENCEEKGHGWLQCKKACRGCKLTGFASIGKTQNGKCKLCNASKCQECGKGGQIVKSRDKFLCQKCAKCCVRCKMSGHNVENCRFLKCKNCSYQNPRFLYLQGNFQQCSECVRCKNKNCQEKHLTEKCQEYCLICDEPAKVNDKRSILNKKGLCKNCSDLYCQRCDLIEETRFKKHTRNECREICDYCKDQGPRGTLCYDDDGNTICSLCEIWNCGICQKFGHSSYKCKNICRYCKQENVLQKLPGINPKQYACANYQGCSCKRCGEYQKYHTKKKCNQKCENPDCDQSGTKLLKNHVDEKFYCREGGCYRNCQKCGDADHGKNFCYVQCQGIKCPNKKHGTYEQKNGKWYCKEGAKGGCNEKRCLKCELYHGKSTCKAQCSNNDCNFKENLDIKLQRLQGKFICAVGTGCQRMKKKKKKNEIPQSNQVQNIKINDLKAVKAGQQIQINATKKVIQSNWDAGIDIAQPKLEKEQKSAKSLVEDKPRDRQIKQKNPDSLKQLKTKKSQKEEKKDQSQQKQQNPIKKKEIPKNMINLNKENQGQNQRMVNQNYSTSDAEANKIALLPINLDESQGHKTQNQLNLPHGVRRFIMQQLYQNQQNFQQPQQNQSQNQNFPQSLQRAQQNQNQNQNQLSDSQIPQHQDQGNIQQLVSQPEPEENKQNDQRASQQQQNKKQSQNLQIVHSNGQVDFLRNFKKCYRCNKDFGQNFSDEDLEHLDKCPEKCESHYCQNRNDQQVNLMRNNDRFYCQSGFGCHRVWCEKCTQYGHKRENCPKKCTIEECKENAFYLSQVQERLECHQGYGCKDDSNRVKKNKPRKCYHFKENPSERTDQKQHGFEKKNCTYVHTYREFCKESDCKNKNTCENLHCVKREDKLEIYNKWANHESNEYSKLRNIENNHVNEQHSNLTFTNI